MKNCPICLDFQATQPKDRTLSHEIPGISWESVGANIFTIKNKHCLSIVDYHSKFPVMKQVEGLSADNLTKTHKINFVEYKINLCQKQRQILFQRISKLTMKK